MALPFFERVITLGSSRFGFTHDLVFEDNQPYLERWIIWFGATLRLHKFHKGDDDRAFHDHPWWFVTFPFADYLEDVPGENKRIVKRWRPHFRSAHHRHIVHLAKPGPVWTFIVTGPKSKEWGFWENDRFIPHAEWLAADELSTQKQAKPLAQDGADLV